MVALNKQGEEKLKSNTIRTSGKGSGIDNKHNWDTIRIGQIGKGGQGDRIYSPNGKSVNLNANGGGRGAKTGLYLITPNGYETNDSVPEIGQANKVYNGGGKICPLNNWAPKVRQLVAPNGKQIILGDEKLQVLKEGRTEMGKKSRKEIKKLTGKDSTYRSKEHKAYFGREGIKANCLTTGLGVEGTVVQNYVIRKLTVVECSRLQSLPDDFVSGIVSNSQGYKCLGNAFNCAVVKHILKNIL
jgi:site-specific DNA-cytosine methylase